MFKILKYGKELWVIVEPTRNLFLRKENSLLTFKTKEEAIVYCENNNLKISPEYK